MKRTNTSIRLATALLLGLMACNNSSSDPHVITSPTTGYITVDGTQLNYVVEGQGKPCLVVGSSIYYPRTFSPALRQELKMYFVDMRWFAREYEAVDLSTYNIQGIAEDIEKVRQALALEQVILIGHSIHGTMALEYAKSYPQHLSQVIAIGSPSVFGSAKFEQATQALWNTASAERKALLEDRRNLLRPTLDDLAPDEHLPQKYVNDAPLYWYDMRYDASWLWEGMPVHSELTDHIFGKLFYDYELVADDEAISVPTLVMLGQYDYVIPYTLWDTAYEQIPDFTLRLFEQSGHTPQLEQPEEFDRALMEWLGNRQ